MTSLLLIINVQAKIEVLTTARDKVASMREPLDKVFCVIFEIGLKSNKSQIIHNYARFVVHE